MEGGNKKLCSQRNPLHPPLKESNGSEKLLTSNMEEDPKKYYVYLVPSTLSRAIAKPTLFGGAPNPGPSPSPSPGPGGSGEDSPKLLLAFSIGAAVRLGQQSCVASLDV